MSMNERGSDGIPSLADKGGVVEGRILRVGGIQVCEGEDEEFGEKEGS